MISSTYTFNIRNIFVCKTFYPNFTENPGIILIEFAVREFPFNPFNPRESEFFVKRGFKIFIKIFIVLE